MDPTLLLTLGVILAATLVGAALRGLHRDRCLRDFDGRPVTVLGKSGAIMWGTVRLQSTGFELEYAADVLDEQLHIETSYLIYKSEYGEIDAMCCFLDDLSIKERERRDEALQRAFHPGLMQCLVRRTRNFVNTALDSLNEALAILLGRARPLAGQLPAAGQTHLKGLTKNILGYVGTSYDPLLERLVGVQSVVEVRHDGGIYEFVGVLRDYSPDFLELLDVYLPRKMRLSLKAPVEGDGSGEAEASKGPITARLEGNTLAVQNVGQGPALVSVSQERAGVYTERASVPAGDTCRIELPGRPQEVHVEARTVVQLDMIFPRATSLIRHRAERYGTNDAFLEALQSIALRERELVIDRLGTGKPHDYQEILLNRTGEFPSDDWLSEALNRREQIARRTHQRAESARYRQQREQVENETPS